MNDLPSEISDSLAIAKEFKVKRTLNGWHVADWPFERVEAVFTDKAALMEYLSKLIGEK
jgi:hypothetical protein